jgi:hypothetical protein
VIEDIDLWPRIDFLGGVKYRGLGVLGRADRLTREMVAYYFARRCVATAYHGHIQIAPCVEAIGTEECFHTTLAERERRITEQALLCGADAGVSTSGETNCGYWIHVCDTLDMAIEWGDSPDLLRRHHPGKEVVIFRISGDCIVGRMFRDPASTTGFLLAARRVEPRHLEVVRRWTPTPANRGPGT